MMAQKFELITELYHQTIKNITSTHEAWYDFLKSACYNFKLSFDEQVLVYAQNLNATAVLEMEDWNKRFGRWVNRGARGIAVFDKEYQGQTRLKYYFDISDTHESYFARPVPLWVVKEEYEEEIIEALEASFGTLDNKSNLYDSLKNAVANVIDDNYQDYFQELMNCRYNSFLEELDELNVKSIYKEALNSSVACMLFERCLGGADQYIELVDFTPVMNFNTEDTINALGIAISDISEMILQEIALTVRSIQKREKNQIRTFAKNYEKQYHINEESYEQPERSAENENNVHETRRLSNTEPSSPSRIRNSPWQIRANAPEVSEREEKNNVHESIDIGETERTFSGNRGNGKGKDRKYHNADGEGRRRDGRTESQRPNEMGRLDEQYQAFSGGNNTGRANLQLIGYKSNLPSFIDKTLVMGLISKSFESEKEDIKKYFSVHSDDAERNLYIKSVYQNKTDEFKLNDVIVGYKPQNNGLLMWEGNYPNRTKESVFSWPLVSSLITQIINKNARTINNRKKPLKPVENQQLSLFDLPDIDNNQVDNQLINNFNISQQIIDEALCIGSNKENSRLTICAYFMKDKPAEENTRFLCEHYGENGAGFFFEDRQVSIWYNSDGILLAEGNTAKNTAHPTLITWEQAAKRIRELLDAGRYMPQDELDMVSDFERRKIASKLWYIRQDFSEEAEEQNLLPQINRIFMSRGGFPENTNEITELLKAPENLQLLIDEVKVFIDIYQKNRDILRFHFHKPNTTLRQLEDLQREPLTFTSVTNSKQTNTFFITNDELDKILMGGKKSVNYRLDILSYFQNHTNLKERSDYLKEKHGYHGSYGGNDNLTYESKGLTFSHGSLMEPYAKVELSWDKVVQRINMLIANGKYVSDEDIAEIPNYQRLELSKQINSFFYNVPEKANCPFPKDKYSDYYDRVQIIKEQLDSPDKVETIYQMMIPIFENTKEDDRNYISRKKAMESIIAYRNGTFSLFKGLENINSLKPVSEPALTSIEKNDKEVELPAEKGQPAKKEIDNTEQIEMPKRTIGDIYREFEPLIISKCLMDRQYMKVREGFSDPEATKKECNNAVRRAASEIAENNPEFAKIYPDVPDVVGRLQKVVFQKTFTDFVDMQKRIEKMGTKQSSENTLARKNYKALMKLAPEILRGECRSIHFKSRGYEPVSITVCGNNRIAVSQYYMQNGDRMFDPEIEFVVDNDKMTLSARTYLNHGLPPVIGNQSVEDENGNVIRPKLERRLNSFAQDLFHAIAEQGQQRDKMFAELPELGNMDITILYGKENQPVEITGWDNTSSVPLNDWNIAVRKFAKEHGISYDLMFSHLGNGVTVCNRLKETLGDYETVAHIASDRSLTVYDKAMPSGVLGYIEDFAKNGDMQISATQHESVFTVPAEKTEEPEIIDYRDLAKQVLRFYGEFNSYSTFNSLDLGSNEQEAVEILENQLKDKEQRPAIVENLQSYLDNVEPNEEVAIDLELFLEKMQELFPYSFKGRSLLEQVEKKLDEAGWAVSEEIIQNGITDYRSRGGKGNYEDISDFIERKYFENPDISELEQETGEYTNEYRLLDRLRSDCDYYLGAGERAEKNLWAGSVEKQILKMRELYGMLPKKPEWLTEQDIDRYEQKMIDSTVRSVEEPAEKGKVEIERYNYHITNMELGTGGAKTKFSANINAIKLLKKLEKENRLANESEQEILSGYVGWGGLPQAFDERNESWKSEYAELKELLNEEEYQFAKASTLNAHYTPPVVIKAIYKALENMGFKTGNILDAGCGTGNFYGCLPDSMEGSKLIGVELDSVTGRIAKQLYQKEKILIQDFGKTELPDSFFDLMIGNVPFGGYSVADVKYDKYKFQIHDYFIAKGLDKLRTGGIMAVITSSGTLDKQNPKVRKYVAERADLLGAIRLPANTFKNNAGTEVTTDILFLQKRDRPVVTEPDWVHLGITENEIPINSYYAENPDMVLGEMSWGNKMYGDEKGTVCKPFPDSDLTELLETAIINIHGNFEEYGLTEDIDEDEILADPNVRNYSFTVSNGKIYFRENSRMYLQTLSLTAENRIRGMIEIRDCTRTLIDLQLNNHTDEEIREEQQKLSVLYEAYTRKYGLINSRANNLVFSSDDSYPLLCSLEILDNQRNFVRKAEIFTKRTIRPPIEITHSDTAGEALACSIGQKARVDMEYMKELTGKDEDILFKELHGQIYRDYINPLSGVYEYRTADDFLSGNIRNKIKTYQKMLESLPENNENYTEIQFNLSELERVKPKDLKAGDIGVRLGTPWIPVSVIQEFVYEILKTPKDYQDKIILHFSERTREWKITGKSIDRRIETTQTYGTKRVTAYKLIENALNLRDIRVYDIIREDGKEKRVLNREETALALDRQEELRSLFVEWLWKEPDRRQKMVEIYNEKYNSIVPREYDGQYIRFVGMNPEIQMRPYQKNAVARGLYGGNCLFAHATGAGKTYSMIALAMEKKRLGLINKAMFVVLNNIVSDFAADFLRLYPSANVLMATEKDIEKKNRRKFFSRIATGNYDGIVIAHSQFGKIPISKERQEKQIFQQIDEIMDAIEEAALEDDSHFTVKQLEKTKKSLETRLERLTDQDNKDSVITFEELGIDQLCIDEADLFKNLFLYSKMRNVAGISNTDSKRASDLFMKTRYLDEITNYHGVNFSTATPVSNSISELYTVQRYLQYFRLEEMGLLHFDDWAACFGETVTKIELAPEATGVIQRTRFSHFYNVPELIAMFHEVADVITEDMLNIPLPKVNSEVIAAEPSEIQKDIVSSFAERADKIRKGMVNPQDDNMLLITNEGRKIALDQRLANPLFSDDEGSKVNLCVEQVYTIWNKTKDKKSAQVIFCDLSTPHSTKPIEMQEVNGNYEMIPDRFIDVYNDIRAKLIKKGIPQEQIMFIHEAKNQKQKAEAFAKVRSGNIRILLGSTTKMGAGSNMQDKLIASHDLDIPWRPRDLQQRRGRIVRYGNENPEVYLYRYVTKGTFDAYMYQLLEQKQRSISQVLSGKSIARTISEIDQSSLEYAEIKALASGNPLIMERCELDTEVSKLNVIRNRYLSQHYELENDVLNLYPLRINLLEKQMEAYEKDIAESEKTGDMESGYISPMILGNETYTKKEEAGKALLSFCKRFDGTEFEIGSYRNFKMKLSRHFSDIVVKLTNAQTYEVELGEDIFGNIARIDNQIKSLPNQMKECESNLNLTREQFQLAKEELKKPFAREQELKEKSARLAELTLLLRLDKSDHEIADDTEDEQEPEKEKSCIAERVR